MHSRKTFLFQGSTQAQPQFGTCCKDGGAVHLEPLNDLPPELKELLGFTDEEAKNFRKIVR